MAAVLSDALHTLTVAQRRAVPVRRIREELAWFTSGDRSDPFAFESVCDTLGIDSGYLRRRCIPEPLLQLARVPLPRRRRRRRMRRCSDSS